MSRFPLLAVLFVTLLPATGLGWQADQQQPAPAPAAQKPPEKPVREFNDETSPPPPAPTPAPAQQPAAAPVPAPAAPPEPAEKPVREFNDENAPPPPAPTSAPAPAPTPAAPPAAQTPAPTMTAREQEMRDLAERFAPVLYQRMAGTAEEHRFDYPTNFDFDGDWKGNNNWANAAAAKFKLWSYVYYSVIESEDHYFIH